MRLGVLHATPAHVPQIANDRARSHRRRALGRDVKDRPTGGALARFGSARERDRAYQRNAYRWRPQHEGFAAMGCHAAMVVAVSSVALFTRLQQRAGIVGSAVAAAPSTGAV
jgi:hypothetical protein